MITTHENLPIIVSWIYVDWTNNKISNKEAIFLLVFMVVLLLFAVIRANRESAKQDRLFQDYVRHHGTVQDRLPGDSEINLRSEQEPETQDLPARKNIRLNIYATALLLPLLLVVGYVAFVDLKDLAKTGQAWMVRIRLAAGGTSVQREIPAALEQALEQGDVILARLLIEKSADVRQIPLMATLDPDLFKLLVEKGADVNARNAEGTPFLMSAALGGQPSDLQKRAVQNLLASKAEVNGRDLNGRTALMFLFVNRVAHSRVPFNKNNTDTMTLLLDHGADVHARDDQGYTALMYALENDKLVDRSQSLTDNDIEALRLLIRSGSDVNAVSNTGKTPLKIAGDIPNPAEQQRVIALLKEAGAKR